MQMQTSLGIVAMHIISSEEGTVTDVAVAVNGVFLLLQRGQSLNVVMQLEWVTSPQTSTVTQKVVKSIMLLS
jgi:hypothetical protein